ncbi:MAG: hypothetical protein QOG17_1759 [Gammaproteobacteria bacterium]|jgi:hypothetical protein|nr:hypothetical protein [Gammaproteobacteria bacterium]
MSAITPEEARDYLGRWALVHAVELEELRRTPMDTKLRQLASLMASREHFTEDAMRENGVQEVRLRWARLKQVLGA